MWVESRGILMAVLGLGRTMVKEVLVGFMNLCVWVRKVMIMINGKSKIHNRFKIYIRSKIHSRFKIMMSISVK